MRTPFPVGRRVSGGLRSRPTPPGPLALGRGRDRALAWTLVVFVVYGIGIYLSCFAGLNPGAPLVLPGQVARSRVVADFEFTYASALRTAELRAVRRERVPPVYRRSLASLEAFALVADSLVAELPRSVSDGTRDLNVIAERLGPVLAAVDPANRWEIAPEDLALLARDLPGEALAEFLGAGMAEARMLLARGILPEVDVPGGGLTLLGVGGDGVSPQPQADALRLFRARLLSLPVPRERSGALYRLLRNALRPNLEYDAAATEAGRAAAEAAVEPVMVTVAAGATLLEPGARVRPLDVEQVEQYRRAQESRSLGTAQWRKHAFEHAILTAITLGAFALALKAGNRPLRSRLPFLRLAGAVLLLNLFLLRLLAELGESAFAAARAPLPLLAPALAPVAFGPILVAVLLGPVPGLTVAALVATFHGLMQGGSLPLALVSLLSGLVAVTACREVQVRSRILRAGLLAGIVPVVGAVIFGLRDEIPWTVVLAQAGCAQLSGLVTGMLVLGLLPVFERAFQLETDITLLELTDFNHPLLRRLQLEAPGTYHHSLMVANLSENAASAVGANPLRARVCALYHDIGKLVKPEYFTENQRGGENPHLERNPSISALIIKSHVKEGLVIARQHRLPRVVRDVIQQHHGTSLIQYFWYRALEQSREAAASGTPGAPRVELDAFNESTYRYEGPRPQFLESAIVFFADSVEAASRSLRKVSPQSIDELVDRLFADRLADGQLAECPLTLQQVAQIKKSFSFTLLTMLHSRVEYPGRPGAKPQAAPAAAAAGPETPETPASDPRQHEARGEGHPG